MSEIDYAARVQRGAALLDEKWPTWAQDIDLDRLDIGDGSCCVTAQYYLSKNEDNEFEANWVYGQNALELSEKEYVALGFNGAYDSFGTVSEDVYAALNTLWRDLIQERRAQPQPEASER